MIPGVLFLSGSLRSRTLSLFESLLKRKLLSVFQRFNLNWKRDYRLGILPDGSFLRGRPINHLFTCKSTFSYGDPLYFSHLCVFKIYLSEAMFQGFNLRVSWFTAHPDNQPFLPPPLLDQWGLAIP